MFAHSNCQMYTGGISCGLNHTLIVSADGNRVFSFGDGDYGKLGLGTLSAHQVSFKIYVYLFYIFSFNKNINLCEQRHD